MRGRPKATGNYQTRADLREAVRSRTQQGQSTRQIARTVGVNHKTVANIQKEIG